MTPLQPAPPVPNINALYDALKQVVDPEMGINIVDLGLIYGIDIGADSVSVEMTMTSPACPMGEMIVEEVEETLRRHLPAAFVPTVRLVWSPPWEPTRMSEKARQHFGW